RRRPTRFSRDWSSDVCSSDLIKLTIRLQSYGFGINHYPVHIKYYSIYHYLISLTFRKSSSLKWAIILSASSSSCNFEFSLWYPTQNIPAPFAALIPFVLSSITIHSSFGATDNDAACSNIAGCGFDLGKSSPLKICVKY